MKLSALFALALGLLACGEAKAQWGLGPGAYFNYGYANSLYTRDYVPYYAMHPPVYYSEPVPRTYGYSPFAYTGFMPTPAPRIVHYGAVVRAHVPKPVIIENPYYTGNSSGPMRSTGYGKSSGVSTEATTGQSIYPASEYPGVRGK